ncbi:hypothetical protein DBR32_10385 [Taibaiella sp. KBW10]|nr:hypothetical protein DBR32_10385 [Taibaiella sp. KBW10]
MLSCFFITRQTVWAQEKVWQTVQQQKGTLQKAKNKQVSKAKGWTNHLKQWGTDSSYTRAIFVGVQLHTNGWSGEVCYLLNKEKAHQTTIRLQFGEIRQEKEIRQQRKGTVYRDLGAFKPYALGKLNKAYTLQLGIGKEYIVFPALLQDQISLKLGMEAGMALALVKPVYLNLIRVDPAQQAYASSEKYTEQNKNLFLSPNNILGADKWSHGLKELNYIPGIYLAPKIIFAPDRNTSFVQKFTIGANVAYYLKEIPIMAQNKNTHWQASFFVGLSLGKRW